MLVNRSDSSYMIYHDFILKLPLLYYPFSPRIRLITRTIKLIWYRTCAPDSRVVLSETVNCCFTRKNQHGGDRERSLPQGPFFNDCATVSWECRYFPEMILILKKCNFNLIIRGQVLDMTVQRNVPRFCTGSICGWNLFQELGLRTSVKENIIIWTQCCVDVGPAS